MNVTIECDQPGCLAPQGGTCAVGHADPSDCPNATVATVEATASDTEPRTVEEPHELAPTSQPEAGSDSLPHGERLRSGETIDLDDADPILARGSARLVIPTGPVGVGKTTLLVELYQRFMSGAWGNSAFGGSESLMAFERLAFPSRMGDRLVLPETWRTRISDDDRDLLHLAIASSTGEGVVDLLLADQSGELSDRVVDGSDAKSLLPLLGVADKVMVLVDGGKMADTGKRHRALSKSRQLLAGLIEGDAVPPRADVALVLTKWDVVQAAGETAMTAWAAGSAALIDRFSTEATTITAMRVSARPMTDLEGEDGLADLLKWLTSPLDALQSTSSAIAPPEGRAFERFDGGAR